MSNCGVFRKIISANLPPGHCALSRVSLISSVSHAMAEFTVCTKSISFLWFKTTGDLFQSIC